MLISFFDITRQNKLLEKELSSAVDSVIRSSRYILGAALLGVPNIMTYKLSWPTYFIGKYILKIGERLPYFSMPNLLLEEKVIPELTMQAATPEAIAAEAVLILKDPARQEKMKASFKILRSKLGSPGVIARAAKAILEFC